MHWRAIISVPGCAVVYNMDDMGRLLGVWAVEDPADLQWRYAALVARCCAVVAPD